MAKWEKTTRYFRWAAPVEVISEAVHLAHGEFAQKEAPEYRSQFTGTANLKRGETVRLERLEDLDDLGSLTRRIRALHLVAGDVLTGPNVTFSFARLPFGAGNTVTVRGDAEDQMRGVTERVRRVLDQGKRFPPFWQPGAPLVFAILYSFFVLYLGIEATKEDPLSWVWSASNMLVLVASYALIWLVPSFEIFTAGEKTRWSRFGAAFLLALGAVGSIVGIVAVLAD